MLRPDLIDMSTIYSMIAPLLALAYQARTSPTASMLSSAYSWLLTLNPIVIIILGVIVFFAGKLAKWVGVIMVIVGVIFLALPYILGAI